MMFFGSQWKELVLIIMAIEYLLGRSPWDLSKLCTLLGDAGLRI